MIDPGIGCGNDSVVDTLSGAEMTGCPFLCAPPRNGNVTQDGAG